jgi:hypothetical protein
MICVSILICLFPLFFIALFTRFFEIVAEILSRLLILLDVQLVLIRKWICGCSFGGLDFLGLKQVADTRFCDFWKSCFRVFIGFQKGEINFLVLNRFIYVDFEPDYLLFFQYLFLFAKLLVFPLFNFCCFFFLNFFFYLFFLYGFEFRLESPF